MLTGRGAEVMLVLVDDIALRRKWTKFVDGIESGKFDNILVLRYYLSI